MHRPTLDGKEREREIFFRGYSIDLRELRVHLKSKADA